MPDLRAEARRAAQRHGLDPNIFVRQIGHESNFDPNARSPAGALGVAQIMPATARGWGVNPLDPRAALNAAAANMARYVRQYGSYDKALRAYNAGPGNVERSKSFGETNAYVRNILGGRDPGSLRAPSGGGPSSSSGGGGTRTTTTTTPGVDNRAARAALVQSFLDNKNSDVLDFATQARALRDIAPVTTKKISQMPGSGSPGSTAISAKGAAGNTDQLIHRANAIDAQRLPYKWGGGHAGRSSIAQAVPLDCSGAVSKVLGIDPRVSGQFTGWGRPGDGGNRGVTIAANSNHVLMKIGGHWFGTSGTNPGGGAGWIPASAISPEYLKGFTLRHSG